MFRTCQWRHVFAVIACCFSAPGVPSAAAEDLSLLSQPGLGGLSGAETAITETERGTQVTKAGMALPVPERRMHDANLSAGNGLPTKWPWIMLQP